MKKFIALFLALVMLVPVCLTSAAAEEVETRPFVMLNWGGAGKRVKNVYSAPYFWTDKNNVQNPLVITAYDSINIKTIAKSMKAQFDARPEGARHINFSAAMRIAFVHYAEHFVYMDKGVKAIRDWMTELMEEYVAIGGKLDGVILDLEYQYTGAYYINVAAKDDPMIYNKIVEDPRYKTVLRPLLEQQGFQFWEDISEYTPEIYSISTTLGNAYADNRTIWNAATNILKNQYMNEAVSEVVWEYFPDALISDYQVADFKGWLRPVGSSIGTTQRAGNASNENMYFIRPSADFYKYNGDFVFNSPDSSYIAPYYDQTPFNQALYETNLFKNIYASTDSGKLTAWIPFYDYGKNSSDHAFYANKACDTPYYSEITFHIGLLNPQPFLGYIYEGDVRGGNYGDFNEKIRVAGQVLDELTRVVGAADRKPLLVPATWNNSYILSGMYAGGRNVWRITPDTTKVSVEDFKIEGTDPTFKVDGVTVTFPGGKIIEDGIIEAVGTCGYWVETATDVYPVVTTDADRYEKFPALLTDFENWKLGAFNFNYTYPVGGWEIKKSGKTSAAEVVMDGEDQALALTGTYALSNSKMPANINAGDSYADEQIWEVTLTVPEGLSAEAEIIMLNYEGKKQKVDDGGFKIAGGKLYYDEAGAYKEWMDLAAGQYILRRKVNLTNAEAITTTYIICDATGAVLGEKKDVAAPACTLPVQNIKMAVKNADKNVLIDDYKIMLDGMATDFMLYAVSNGMKLGDLTQPQTKDVAYRLGWLNATDEEQSVSVVAATYEGETLVSETVLKEVKMLPGCDNIETGVVEVEEGKAVKVYLKTAADIEADKNNNNSGDNNTGDNNTGDTGKPAGKLNPIVLVVAAAAVVVVAVVIVLIVTKKSAKKAETEEVEGAEETQTSEEE